jgi:hypothetical protein
MLGKMAIIKSKMDTVAIGFARMIGLDPPRIIRAVDTFGQSLVCIRRISENCRRQSQLAANRSISDTARSSSSTNSLEPA